MGKPRLGRVNTALCSGRSPSASRARSACKSCRTSSRTRERERRVRELEGRVVQETASGHAFTRIRAASADALAVALLLRRQTTMEGELGMVLVAGNVPDRIGAGLDTRTRCMPVPLPQRTRLQRLAGFQRLEERTASSSSCCPSAMTTAAPFTPSVSVSSCAVGAQGSVT
jgi:hypothetical protein